MIDFMQTRPTAIKAGFGNTIFYYGVEPHGLSKLPTRSEFTLVYSPSQEYGWEAVLYRVLHTDKTYFVVDRRALDNHEIEHFEQLLRGTPYSQSDLGLDGPFGLMVAPAPTWLHWLEASAARALVHLGLVTIAPCPN